MQKLVIMTVVKVVDVFAQLLSFDKLCGCLFYLRNAGPVSVTAELQPV